MRYHHKMPSTPPSSPPSPSSSSRKSVAPPSDLFSFLDSLHYNSTESPPLPSLPTPRPRSTEIPSLSSPNPTSTDDLSNAFNLQGNAALASPCSSPALVTSSCGVTEPPPSKEIFAAADGQERAQAVATTSFSSPAQWLPRAQVVRLVKEELGAGVRVTKEAIDMISTSGCLFALFLAAAARDTAHRTNR
eukprot:GHVQ01033322.1.p1 GENE.GHVQ01033322.1~~GHVQ01033322.1.p1  ORF type:complete len:190 (-),score=31.70 GHVQ01033322.1:792-1361(-)